MITDEGDGWKFHYDNSSSVKIIIPCQSHCAWDNATESDQKEKGYLIFLILYIIFDKFC